MKLKEEKVKELERLEVENMEKESDSGYEGSEVEGMGQKDDAKELRKRRWKFSLLVAPFYHPSTPPSALHSYHRWEQIINKTLSITWNDESSFLTGPTSMRQHNPYLLSLMILYKSHPEYHIQIRISFTSHPIGKEQR
jgi:hypothetical protein